MGFFRSSLHARFTSATKFNKLFMLIHRLCWFLSKSPVRRFLLIHIWSNVWSSALESFAGPWENVIQSVMTWPWSEVKLVLVHKTKGAGQAQRSRLKGSSIGMFNFDQPWFGPMPKKERKKVKNKIGVIYPTTRLRMYWRNPYYGVPKDPAAKRVRAITDWCDRSGDWNRSEWGSYGTYLIEQYMWRKD